MTLGLMRLAKIPSSHGSSINTTLNNSEEVKLFYRVTFTFVNVILLKFIFFSGINDCSEAPKTTGIYTVFNHGFQPFPVYCDQLTDGGGILYVLLLTPNCAFSSLISLINRNH